MDHPFENIFQSHWQTLSKTSLHSFERKMTFSLLHWACHLLKDDVRVINLLERFLNLPKLWTATRKCEKNQGVGQAKMNDFLKIQVVSYETFSTDIYSVYFELFFHNFSTRLHWFSYFNGVFDRRTRKNILTDSKNSFFWTSESVFPILCLEVVFSFISYSWLSFTYYLQKNLIERHYLNKLCDELLENRLGP